MVRRFEISLVPREPEPDPGPRLPGRKRSFFQGVRGIVAGIAVTVLALAVIVAAVILGSVIALVAGILLAAILAVGVVRAMCCGRVDRSVRRTARHGATPLNR